MSTSTVVLYESFEFIPVLTKNIGVFLQRFTVPQRWFIYFYVLGLLVNTVLLSLTFLFAYACTFPMHEHESQVSAIFSALGGN